MPLLRARDGAILVRIGELRGEKVHQRRIDAVRIVLLGLREELLIERAEVEELVLADRAADGAAELLLFEIADAGSVGKLGRQAAPLLVFESRRLHSQRLIEASDETVRIRNGKIS